MDDAEISDGEQVDDVDVEAADEGENDDESNQSNNFFERYD